MGRLAGVDAPALPAWSAEAPVWSPKRRMSRVPGTLRGRVPRPFRCPGRPAR